MGQGCIEHAFWGQVRTTSTQTGGCEFPGCDNSAPLRVPYGDAGGPSLCLEHDALLFYDSAEFHRVRAARNRRCETVTI
jgi:hypothetical protein